MREGGGSSNRVNKFRAADSAAKDGKIGVTAKVYYTSDIVNKMRAADAAAKAEETHCLIRPKPPVVPVDEEEEEARRAWGWLPLASLLFPRPDPEPVRVGVPLDTLQVQRFDDSPKVLGRLERLARDSKIVLECLGWYNSMHPGEEYEPAPGMVIDGSRLDRGMCWTHGNFVARRKLSGCLSFPPAPPTLFFFELTSGKNINKVVTCTPLDEPVTETSYNVLGFHVGWGGRRHGGSDCICKTCYRQHPYALSTCVCEDSKVEPVCDMCYPHFGVIHPIQGGFALGYNTKLERDFFRPHKKQTSNSAPMMLEAIC